MVFGVGVPEELCHVGCVPGEVMAVGADMELQKVRGYRILDRDPGWDPSPRLSFPW